nr:Uncharacterised protein [Streptococcus thermophilus]
MTYFDETFTAMDPEHRQRHHSWYQPGISLREAYEAIQQIPVKRNAEDYYYAPGGKKWDARTGKTFFELRLREVFEGVEIAHDDAYSALFIGESSFERNFLLWHDPELRGEPLWQLFSFPGARLASFAVLEDVFGAHRYDGRWSETLVALDAEHLIDRDRLLDEMLIALGRGFSRPLTQWFSKHFTDFNPTEEELSTRQRLLFAALSSGVPSNAFFAIKQLKRLSRLDDDAFAAVAPHAFGASNAAGINALKMLDAIASRREDLHGLIADAAMNALYHDADAVVRGAAALLCDLGRDELVAANADSLSPVMAAELVGGAVSAAASSQVEYAPVEAEPVVAFTDDDALFRTRELFATPDPVGVELLVAWLARTGPRALDILAPVIPDLDGGSGFAKKTLCRCLPDEITGAFEFGPFYEGVGFDLDWVKPAAQALSGQRPPHTMLSTPTDSFGRVDTAEFHRRLATYANAEDVDPVDYRLALTRLNEFGANESEQALAPVIVQAKKYTYAQYATTEPSIFSGHTFRRTVNGWEDFDTEEGFWLQAPPNPDNWQNPDLAARVAMMAPSCTDFYTYAWLETMRTAHDGAGYPIEHVIDVLFWHPGEWTFHTAAFVGLALHLPSREARARAAELTATRLAHSIPADTVAEAWVQFDDIKLGRWAAGLTDAATINPSYVRDLLDHLLPRLDHKARDLAKLIELYRNVRLQTGHVGVDKRMREWLESFSGKSKAAQAAAALLKETET